jgi:hypothetical protein
LQQVALLVNGSAKVPVQFYISQQHVIKKGEPTRGLDVGFVGVGSYHLPRIGTPKIDTRMLPTLLDLHMLRANELAMTLS